MPAFKAALMVALQADENLEQLKAQVQATYPGSALRPTAMYYGKTESENSTPVIASAARIKRQERYAIDLHIDVAGGQSDVTPTEMICFQMMGEVDNILATQTTLGLNPSTQWQVLSSFILKWDSRPYFDDTRQGWANLLTLTIQVKTRLL